MTKTSRSGRALFAIGGLALAIASVLPATSLDAATLSVTSCGDSTGDSGTLRSKIAQASSADIVTLAGLTCPESTISLIQGTLQVGVADLTVESSTTNHVYISGSDTDRVFYFTGAGTLTLSHVTVERGSFTTPTFSLSPGVEGGCIYATGGSVALVDSTVTACSIFDHTQRNTGSEGARGGAIGAPEGTVTMTRSTVSFSLVDSIDPYFSTEGGGIQTHSLSLVDSIITGNLAVAGTDEFSRGGGVSAENVSITGSAIFNNEADSGGGIYVEGGVLGSSILNSTISGNVANFEGGGIALIRDTLAMTNVTLSFNTASIGGGLYSFYGPVIMESSILANNSSPTGNRSDLRLSGNLATVSGSHNIITDTTDVLPSGTITLDPKLAPLALHGGLTPVHPLLPTSPALNAGTNTENEAFDQRGAGFPRTYGSATDIGAYESQGKQDDELFYSAFEAFQ